MNGLLLGIVGLIYLALAASYLWSGKTGLCIAFAAYALANLGLYLAGEV